MSWRDWTETLRQAPLQAVSDLLRGAADITPYERAAPHDFLLAVLPRTSRVVQDRLLGEPEGASQDAGHDLPALLDKGLKEWLEGQRQASLPPARKLAYLAAQVCEALQWPLYFDLPLTRTALAKDRVLWLQWTRELTLSAFCDPEYDYWQVLASRQDDDALQSFWQGFVVEAGRTRYPRYLNLGLLALARLPLSEEDGQHNLRLQVQALVNRYQLRRSWGVAALEELAENLRGVIARNPSLSRNQYFAFITDLLGPLGEDKTHSLMALLGLSQQVQAPRKVPKGYYKLQPPGLTPETDAAVAILRCAENLAQGWRAIERLLTAHEVYLRKSGDAYYFVRTLDRCARALCERFSLSDPDIQSRLFQWIHLALRLEPENPRLWMLWELALRRADYKQRAQWVLREMTRRFPDDLHSRLELARLLADSSDTDDQAEAQRLLQQVLELDPEKVHVFSTLAQLAIRRRDWGEALKNARKGLRLKPDDGPLAVLLAQAYARRNQGDDLKNAIDELQRFVTRYRGNTRAEGYLVDLQKRQHLAAQGRLLPLEEEAMPTVSPMTAESDPAWLAFASSLSAGTSSAEVYERVLPLPQALRLAVEREDWDAVAQAFDAAAQRDFPLETRLWLYLQSLQGNAPETERKRARDELKLWLEKENHSTNELDSGAAYLSRLDNEMLGLGPEALTKAREWLRALLDRYRSLPAPLFA